MPNQGFGPAQDRAPGQTLPSSVSTHLPRLQILDRLVDFSVADYLFGGFVSEGLQRLILEKVDALSMSMSMSRPVPAIAHITRIVSRM